MQLKGKTILITGASSGIGQALVFKLANLGANLILLSRRIELLYELSNYHKDSRVQILPIKCDVSNQDEVKAAFSLIKKAFAKIDIAILNAGTSYRQTPHNFKSKYAEEILGTNFLGMVYPIEELLPYFLDRKEGIIAGVSSLADNRGYSGSGFYCASKSAVSTFLEGLRVDLRKHNIKVITVKPGFVKTPMTDKNDFMMPFIMSAEKAAGIIIKGIYRGKRVIQFPLRMVILTRLIGILPDRFYEYLSGLHLEKR